jgi:hypothetical protein
MTSPIGLRSVFARGIGFLLWTALFVTCPVGADAQMDPPAECGICVDRYWESGLPEGWYHQFTSEGVGERLTCTTSTVGGHPIGCDSDSWHPTSGAPGLELCSEFHPECADVSVAVQEFLTTIRRADRSIGSADLEELRRLGARVEEVHAGLVQVRDCSGSLYALLPLSRADAAD